MCLAEARLAASIISKSSIKFSLEGLVDPIIKILVPRMDSSYDG